MLKDWVFSSPSQGSLLVRRIEGGEGDLCRYAFPSISSENFRATQEFIEEFVLGSDARLIGGRMAVVLRGAQLFSFKFSGTPLPGHVFVGAERLLLGALVSSQLLILQDYLLWLSRHNDAWREIALGLNLIETKAP